MKKIITLALVALTTLSMWAAYDVPATGSPVTLAKKVSNSGHFTIEATGLYHFRLASGYSWADGKGIKTQSNQGGLVFYLNQPTEVEVTIQHTSTKKPHDVTVHVYVLPETDYKQFDDNKEQEDKNKSFSTLTTSGEDKSFTVSVAAEVKDFTGSTMLQSGYYALVPVGAESDTYLNAIEFKPGCTNPSEALKLSADKTENIYKDDEINFTVTGGNGTTTKIEVDDVELSGTKWTATKGTHTIRVSQEANGDVCGGADELVLAVGSKDPVVSVTITGEKNAVIGKEHTLLCTAENATKFQWYKGGVKIDGATSAEYKFTPDAEGKITFACEAWNDYTDPAKKAEIEITVTEAPEVCGVLAQVSVTGKNKGQLEPGAKFAGTVSVAADETAVYDGYTGYKLKAQDSHVGIAFSDGTLQAGDKVMVFVTKVSDGKKLQIFSDKGTTLIAETDNLQLGENTFVLGESANGGTGLYVYRKQGGTDGAQYNAYIAYVKLKRKCAGESDDASVTSFKINDQDVSAEGGTYSYEVPEDYMGTEIEVKFELAAGATADQTSPLKIKVPNAGETTEVKITVTAQDGETKVVYTVKVSKAAAPKSTDASITELKINNEVVAEKEGAFAYEVAAEATLDSVEVVFTVAEKATAAPASPFKMLVPEAGAAATEAAIKVTAEDGTTVKEYKVSVTKAKKTEALDNVADETKAVKVIRDGQLYILKNGVLYNAQGTAL